MCLAKIGFKTCSSCKDVAFRAENQSEVLLVESGTGGDFTESCGVLVPRKNHNCSNVSVLILTQVVQCDLRHS